MSRSVIMDKLVRAAKKTYEQVLEPSSFRDFGHNEYVNTLCNNLHAEGVNFQREKIIGGRKPDIFIEGFGAVEVKAKTAGFNQDDIKQAEDYVRYSNLPCQVINFRTQNGPHFREFK